MKKFVFHEMFFFLSKKLNIRTEAEVIAKIWILMLAEMFVLSMIILKK